MTLTTKKAIPMKFFSLLTLIFVITSISAQDSVSRLTRNPDLYGKIELSNKVLSNSFDSTFYYITDTLTLPFFDDFSRNKFQKYNAKIGDANVTEKLYHKILDENTQLPLSSDLVLTTSRTYRSVHDPTNDTTIIHYFDSTRFFYSDLATFAPDYELVYAFPPYFILDTLDGLGNLADTIWVSLPEFKQDSARIFIAEINNPEKLWLNEQAYHNYRFANN